MLIDFHGLKIETPGVAFYLWSAWRAASLEHRLFEAVRNVPGGFFEERADERRVRIHDLKAWRLALQALSRVLKGWQEEAEPGSEHRSWRWLLEGDVNADGYARGGEPANLWGFLSLSIDRGGPGEEEKGEDIDLDNFGAQLWTEEGG